MRLWHYIQGDRKGKEAHRIEKEAMKDPFLADALEGYERVAGNHRREVMQIQKQIERKASNRKPLPWRAWGIAASILIVVGMGSWFFLTDPSENMEIQATSAIAFEEDASESTAPEGTTLESIISEDVAVKQKSMAKQAEPAPAVALSRIQTESATSVADSSETSAPVAGMESYLKYIKQNLKQPTDEACRRATGDVVLKFKVGQSGRPYNIRVTKGVCASINKEAIRLVAEGPDWQKGNTDDATITIRF